MNLYDHLVLIPGMLCDQRQWQYQQEFFRSKCQSVYVADTTRGDSIEQIAKQVFERAPKSFALAGLSMGGIIAFEMWRQAPERISRLAVLDTNASMETVERGEARSKLLQRALMGELMEVMAESLKPQYLAKQNQDNQELLDTIMKMAIDLGEKVFEKQVKAVAGRADSIPTLKTISVPTLVLCGEEDSLCPVSFHEAIADQIPNAQLAVIKNCGHLSTMEQPNLVNQELELWLNAA